MKNTRTLRQALIALAAIAFIGFGFAACDSPTGPGSSNGGPVTHVVNFISEGVLFHSQPVTHGETANRPGSAPTRADWTFVDWFAHAVNGTTPFSFSTTPITVDTNLYARWTQTLHTVTFNTGGGSPEPPPQPVPDGGTATEPPAPALGGHGFTGWFDEDGERFIFTTPVTEDITLYAGWVVLHAVTFRNYNGNVLYTQQVPNGGNAAALEPAPTRAGHDFTGWYTGAEDGELFNFETPVTEPLTLHARWAIQRFTVGFYIHGGTPPAPVNQTVDWNTTATEPPQPARPDYRFVGWFTEAAGGELFIFTTPITAAITLHARWVEQDQHSVIFHLHGGSMEGQPLVPVRDGQTVSRPTNNPTRPGHDFTDWFTEATGGELFDFTAPITDDTDIHAQWNIRRFTVRFEMHGGSPPAPQQENIAWNTDATEPQAPTRPGHDFAGWYTEATGGTRFVFGTTPVTDNTTLHARWNIRRFDVTFNTHGGSAVQTQSVDWNTAPSRPANNPTRPGHYFTDWFTEATGGERFNFAAPVTGDTTVHARWNIRQFTVSFEMHGGSPQPPQQTVNWNASATQPQAPTMEGRDFAGWYTEATGGTRFVFGTTPVTDHITLHARWNIRQFTVLFLNDDGSTMHTQTVDWNTTASRPYPDPARHGVAFSNWSLFPTGNNIHFDFSTPITENTTLHARWGANLGIGFYLYEGAERWLTSVVPWNTSISQLHQALHPQNPTREGHDFVGWFTAPTGGEPFSFDTPITVIFTWVYAQWTVRRLDVTFNTHGGSTVQTQTVDWNTTATQPPNPTREGHTFAGWFTDPTGGTQFNFNTPVTDHITAHARWNIHRFTVSFNMHGGTPQPPQQTVDWNTTATRPANDPTRPNYTFAGWFTQATGGTPFNFTAPVTANAVVHAQWTPPGTGGIIIRLVDITDRAANLPVIGPTFNILSTSYIAIDREEIGVESLEWWFGGSRVEDALVSVNGNITTLTLDSRIHGNRIGTQTLTLEVRINGNLYSRFVDFTTTVSF